MTRQTNNHPYGGCDGGDNFVYLEGEKKQVPARSKGGVASGRNAGRGGSNDPLENSQPLLFSERLDRVARMRVNGSSNQDSEPEIQTLVKTKRSRKRVVTQPKEYKYLKRFSQAITILAAFAAIGFGIRYFFTSSNFQIHRVLIRGTNDSQVIAAVNTIGLKGQNILLVNSSHAIKKLEELPVVKTVQISKTWPDILTVNVHERTAVIAWQTPSEIYAVDADGVVMGAIPNTGGLPVVTGTLLGNQGQVHPGSRVDTGVVGEVASLAQQVPETTGVSKFSMSFTNADTGVVVTSSTGWQAEFGNQDQLDVKTQELASILKIAHTQRQPVDLIDLRFDYHPYYRLKPSPTPTVQSGGSSSSSANSGH